MSSKTGDRRQITICNSCREGRVIRAQEIQTAELKGQLVAYEVEGYGETGDYWEPEGSGEEAAQYRTKRSRMPPEYVHKTAQDFKWNLYGENVEPQKKIANAFVRHFAEFRRQGRGLYIQSKTKGSGKTFLACCIANEVIKRNDVSVKFITAPEYIELICEKGEQEREDAKQIKNCTLLILDDLGAEPEKPEWVARAIFRLVDWRDKNFLPTIYTSNCSMEELKGDERTIDRIISHSVLLQMPEIGIRRRKFRQANERFFTGLLSEEEEGGAFQ